MYLVRNMMFTRVLRKVFPQRRTRVMSWLPPPSANRVPLAKSAPDTRASTNLGISAGSADPSASSMTRTSPVAAVKPHAIAFPLPLRVW